MLFLMLPMPLMLMMLMLLLAPASTSPPSPPPIPQVRGCAGGTLRIDFGAESAGWLELLSEDIPPEAVASMRLAISETNVRLPGKARPPVAHAGGVYRLETNWALYEGVRFGFLQLDSTCGNHSAAAAPPPPPPWHIRAIRVAAQSLKVPYRGHFLSEGRAAGSAAEPLSGANDTLLSQVWWAGAYGPKLNMGTDQLGPGAVPPSTFMLNAVLADRGDRSRRRDCHFADTPFPSRLKHLLKLGGGAAE